jgi:hypothetical protein
VHTFFFSSTISCVIASFFSRSWSFSALSASTSTPVGAPSVILTKSSAFEGFSGSS